MAQEIHYEVFRRDGPKGGWQLADVIFGREAAMQFAERLMKSETVSGVKVVKETFTPETGEYLSLKIFEDGHANTKIQPVADDVPYALPCLTPEDLYSSHARATIARLLAEFLQRHTLTVSELMHRADALEKLEATGTIWQFAVQKLAVAQAASTTTPVQQIIRNLNELATQAAHRVYRDTRRGYFPVARRDEFGRLAERLARQADGAYRLTGALSRHIAAAQGWNAKLEQLFLVLAEAPPDSAGRALLVAALDTLIAEVLRGTAALHELLGGTENPRHALLLLTELFLGHTPEGRADDTLLAVLSRHFAADTLAESRAVIGQRVIAELRSMRRLCPASLDDELALGWKVAAMLAAAPEKYLRNENVLAALMLRSRRLVAHDIIAEHLSRARSPDEKLEMLLDAEQQVAGEESKKKLAAYALPLVTSLPFEQRFLSPNEPALDRLKMLADLQTRVRRSDIPPAPRDELAHAIDAIACEVESRAKLLQIVGEKSQNPAERVTSILALCGEGRFTEGLLLEKARHVVLHELRRPGFFTGYVSYLSQEGKKPDAESAMEQLIRALTHAGISPDASLKSIAA